MADPTSDPCTALRELRALEWLLHSVACGRLTGLGIGVCDPRSTLPAGSTVRDPRYSSWAEMAAALGWEEASDG